MPMTACADDTDLPPLLRCRGVDFSFADQTLFEHLDLELRPGHALLLVGSNGSGKSTLLRLLAGLLPPDEGTVERAIDGDTEPLPVAWLGHTLGLKLSLTVAENLHCAEGLHGRRPRRAQAQALASVGLEGYAHVPVAELSAGQRKRVALARLLLIPAPIWLLDEPYANLDPDGCLLVDRLIDQHLREGSGAVLSVHHADQAGFLGPHRALILSGDA